MQTTKVALENERKIQQLQMQAINALWKKVSTLQPTAGSSALTTDLQAIAGGSETANTHSTAVVQDLAKTCTVLTNQVGRCHSVTLIYRIQMTCRENQFSQVQQLQGSMRDIIQCMTVLCKLPPSQDQQQAIEESNPKPVAEVKDSSSTQTEIIAVHTPQVENLPFPFANRLPRPSTLMLIETNESTTSAQKIAEADVAENDPIEPTNVNDKVHDGSGDSARQIDLNHTDLVTRID